MRQCSVETCFVPDTGCALGHINLTDCPQLTEHSAAGAPKLDSIDEVLLPWSGSALGLADLNFVSGQVRPFVVGIAGSQNAGKTTLLGAWYLLLGRGAASLPERQFAGSYSIAGWEAVSGSLRWDPGQPPSFPPHTTSKGGRAPGLLHLSFWDATKARSIEYLFADAPGEWFQKWAINRDSEESVGARWVAERADVFIIVADREALSSENMGVARNGLRLLARRLADELGQRPVALVWTKSDIAISSEIEHAVRQAVLDVMPDAAEFFVSVVPTAEENNANGTGLIELLSWIVRTRRDPISLPAPAAGSSDPLFMFGARP